MDKKDIKKFFVIQYIIIGLLIGLCLFLLIDRKNNSLNENSGNNSAETTNAYDVSMMNEINVSEFIKMFESKKDYVVYIGRETCGVCKAILPNLVSAQNDLNYTTQYLDITKVDRNSSEWLKLEKLLDKETTLSVNGEDGKKTLKTESYGYFIGKYGYTPTLIIVKDNKMVAGHIGNFEINELTSWLKSNGIG